MELHHSLDRLRAEGIELYAISYDDTEALADYVAASGVEFTMLSDADSRVIREYGVLNTIVQPDDVPFYGIPFPGFFLVNEDGVIVDKLFNRHLANREGVETILDSFAGRIEPGANEPIAAFTEDDGIEVTAFLRGGGGELRVGPRRRLVVRFELPDGLHIYNDPVPEGMVATSIEITGPAGLRCEETQSPATRPLTLPGVETPLQVWDNTVDFVTPLFASSEMIELLHDDTEPTIRLHVHVRYQACDDTQCFLPRSRTVDLDVPLRAGVKPGFSRLRFPGSDPIEMDADTHWRRMIERQRPSDPTAGAS